MISIVKESKLLRQGCVGYWCYEIEGKKEEVKIKKHPVVCDFPDIFPKELLGSQL